MGQGFDKLSLIPPLTDWFEELNRLIGEGDFESAKKVASAILYRAKIKDLWMSDYEASLISNILERS